MNAPPARWELALYVTLAVFMLGSAVFLIAPDEGVVWYLVPGGVAFAVVYGLAYRLIGDVPKCGASPYAPPQMPPGRVADYLRPLK